VRRALPAALALCAVAAGCAAGSADRPDYADVPAWTSHAVPEARGDVKVLADGKREALRYRGWTKRDFAAFRTYAYADTHAEVPVSRAAMPAGLRGDPAKGRALFLSRAKGPCSGCHLIPGADVWPAGNVGPDLSTIGDRRLSDEYLYQQIHDPRVVFPATAMPPWGAAGILSPKEIADLVAFLQTLRSPLPPERIPSATRPRGASRWASATTSIPRTTPRCSWPRTPRRSGPRAARRAAPAPTATAAVRARP
jgi:sulfur oxidation c-type cytochrome SoxX